MQQLQKRRAQIKFRKGLMLIKKGDIGEIEYVIKRFYQKRVL